MNAKVVHLRPLRKTVIVKSINRVDAGFYRN
jgi:hypothetical protein